MLLASRGVRRQLRRQLVGKQVKGVADDDIVRLDPDQLSDLLQPSIQGQSPGAMSVACPVVPLVSANGVGATYILRSRTSRSPYDPKPRKLLFLWT